MIFVTGDTHGEFERFSSKNFPEQRGMTKDDYVIICGDFGIWEDSPSERYWYKWLSDKPLPLCSSPAITQITTCWQNSRLTSGTAARFNISRRPSSISCAVRSLRLAVTPSSRWEAQAATM